MYERDHDQPGTLKEVAQATTLLFPANSSKLVDLSVFSLDSRKDSGNLFNKFIRVTNRLTNQSIPRSILKFHFKLQILVSMFVVLQQNQALEWLMNLAKIFGPTQTRSGKANLYLSLLD